MTKTIQDLNGLTLAHCRRSAGGRPRAVGVHVFGRDCAETLQRWIAAFDAHADTIRAQGFGERFRRCWHFCLAYCAAGFATGSTDVGQYTLVAR